MAKLASGARLEIFESLDSTSLEAKRRAAAGERGPIWIVALRQTAGYGRRGSEWIQQVGDIATTFLFRASDPAEKLPQLSFVTALAVRSAVRRFAPMAQISLKWPNDILAGDGKIAGLLLELVGTPAEPVVAVGVGVNVVSAPAAVDYPTARLLDISRTLPQPREFVVALDETFDAWRNVWVKSGFGAIRAEWLQYATRVGEKIRVRLARETIEGVFTDLDSEGALILDCADGRRTIAAGAVLPAIDG